MNTGHLKKTYHTKCIDWLAQPRASTSIHLARKENKMKHILDILASFGLVVLPVGATIIVWILIAKEIIRVM